MFPVNRVKIISVIVSATLVLGSTPIALADERVSSIQKSVNEGLPFPIVDTNKGQNLSRVVVKLTPEANPQEIAKKVKAEVLRQGPLHYVTLAIDTSHVAEKMNELQRAEGVLSVQLSQKVSTHQINITDPYYAEQWGLVKAEVPRAWELGASGEGVTVAIIDTGVDVSHPDLKTNLLPGYNALTGREGLEVVQDNNGHGTHVAGVLAASLNGEGIVGVAHKAKILPIKAMNRSGEGQDDIIAEGIVWAADQGARIINLSLGSDTETEILKDAIRYAKEKGSLVIAAAGNKVNGQEFNTMTYPARDPNVLAVSATDKNDQIASFSLTGSQVALAAPGVNIFSDFWQNRSGYASTDGTSMASPFVAGVAALVWGENPELTADEVRGILEASAQELGTAGRDSFYGYGRVNAYWALRFAQEGKKLKSPARLDWAGGEVEGVSGTAQVTLQVPPRAFDQNSGKEVTIQVKEVSGTTVFPPEITPQGEGFLLEWEGNVQKQLTLNVDLNIQLPKDSKRLGFLYRWSGTRWIKVGGGSNSSMMTVGITEPGLYRMGFTALPESNRIAGEDRIQTAIEISKSGFSNGADTVILARADDFPDALAGVPFAYKLHAPILLTEVNKLPDSVLSEIQRLKPQTLLLLGGTGAISLEVEEKLRELGKVRRIAGINRYATAAAIADELGTIGEAILVNGENFPDAISIGAAAAENGIPILLTQTKNLPTETEAVFRKYKVSKTLVVGGAGMISEEQVETYPTSIRLAGLDRYETAIEVLKAYPPKGGLLYLATGENFPDALTGGVLAALHGTRIILTPPSGLSSEGEYLIRSWKGISPLALGGKTIVPDSILSQVQRD